MPELDFLLPGDPRTATGGYLYDWHIAAGLEALGWQVRRHRLADAFPHPDAAALRHAEAVLAALPDAALVLIDGLALGAMPEQVARHAGRLRLVGLLHHPLAMETGLDDATRAALRASEAAALQHLRRVLVTSPSTALELGTYGVDAGRIGVVVPGTAAPSGGCTDVARPGATATHGALRLLCVATLVPRKGHLLLLEALSGLDERSWTLDCVGSLQRHPATADAVRRACAAQRLAGRVTLHGEVPARTLGRYYRAADLFVLASHHEGYGMALAEALAHGLPVVSTRAGAIAETVPAAAGLLVAPGDAAALREALARVMDDADLRKRLAAAARAAGTALPDWAGASRRFAAELQRVAST